MNKTNLISSLKIVPRLFIHPPMNKTGLISSLKIMPRLCTDGLKKVLKISEKLEAGHGLVMAYPWAVLCPPIRQPAGFDSASSANTKHSPA